MFQTINPFLIIFLPSNQYITQKDYRSIPATEWIEVYRTEYIENNINPSFDAFLIDRKELCKGNEATNLKIQIWSKGYEDDEDQPDRLIGTGYFSVQSNFGAKRNIDVFDVQGIQAGTIITETFERRDMFSMIQHIKNGLTLNLVASIDFTSSNGHPSKNTSLHFINTNGKNNQYQESLYQIFSVIEPYDCDKQIPVYGFGASGPDLGYSNASHLFQLSGKESSPNVTGTSGVMELYLKSLPKIRQSGPTYFAPTINSAVQLARGPSEENEYTYTVVLILTDGTVCDIEETYRAIESAAKLPISIIIVGVGEEDFTQMNILDGNYVNEECDEDMDEQMKDPKNPINFKPVRDIVQFVSFKEFKEDPVKLSKTVLEQLPTQISEYFCIVINNRDLLS